LKMMDPGGRCELKRKSCCELQEMQDLILQHQPIALSWLYSLRDVAAQYLSIGIRVTSTQARHDPVYKALAFTFAELLSLSLCQGEPAFLCLPAGLCEARIEKAVPGSIRSHNPVLYRSRPPRKLLRGHGGEKPAGPSRRIEAAIRQFTLR